MSVRTAKKEINVESDSVVNSNINYIKYNMKYNMKYNKGNTWANLNASAAMENLANEHEHSFYRDR